MTQDQPLDQRALHIMMRTAAHHASRIARTMALSETDREDAEQDILLALIERRRFFDPARGAWSSFADRVARQMAQVIADRIGQAQLQERRAGANLGRDRGGAGLAAALRAA